MIVSDFEVIWHQLFDNSKKEWPVAQEGLMQQLPKGIERPSEPGIFFIKKYPGSYAIVVLTTELVTCGGENGKARADEFASRLNGAWNKWFEGGSTLNGE